MIVIDEHIFRECIHRIDKLGGLVTKELKRHQAKLACINKKILQTRWELLSSIKTEDTDDKSRIEKPEPEKTG